MVHGIAGSAGVALLATSAMESQLWAVAYLTLFGLGSVGGMVLLTIVLSWRALNPEARIVRAQRGRVVLDHVVGTRLYDSEKAALYAGWARELAGQHTPETLEFGVASFVYRARRPFHPKRLQALFASEWSGVLRSKGFFWLARRGQLVAGRRDVQRGASRLLVGVAPKGRLANGA